MRAAVALILTVVGWAAIARAQPAPTPVPAPGQPPPAAPAPPGPGPTTPTVPAPVTPTVPAPVAEPPPQWTRWELTGSLIDPPEQIRTLIGREMESHRALTASARGELAAMCKRLGYQLLELEVTRPGDGEVVATLHLEPILMVRWVDVQLSQRVYDVLLDDEVRRRMRLRPGVYLPWDFANRNRQLTSEQDRIEAYLRDEGFFEAEAKVGYQQVGRYGAKITVKATLGPSYRVGAVGVANAGATGGGLPFSDEDIAAEFRHGFACILGRCRFTRAQLQADLERVTRRFQRRGYPSVRIQTDFDPRTSFDRDSQRVTFNVTIDPRRKIDVVFEGNDKDAFSDELLTSRLTFGAATSADDIEVAASARALEALYQSRGYLDVVITSERVRLRTFDRVIYRIEAGPPRVVRTVDFACAGALGGCSLSPAELSDAVAVRPASAFRLFTTPTYPTREGLQADVASLERLYRNRGFLSARARLVLAPTRAGWASAAVSAAEVAAEVAPKDVHVRFEIDEGPRTVVSRIEIVFEGGAAGGRFAGDEDRIRDRLKVKPGDPYLKDTLDAEAQALKDWYWSLGRPRAVVTVGEPVPLADDHHVAVTFNIEEKQELSIGEIVIRGNFRTRDWVIRDQLGFASDAPLTADLQTSGLRRLRSTNLFNGVSFELLHFEDARQTTIDVVVRVEERYDLFAQIDMEAGYSQQNGAFLRAKPVAPNLWGVGVKLDLALTLGTEYQSAETSLRLPRWLLARKLRLPFDGEVAGFVRNQTTERFGDLRSLGGSLALVRSWERAKDEDHRARLVTAAFRYDVRQRTRDEDAIRPAGVAASITQNPIQTQTGTLGLTMTWDERRDASGNLNPLAPSSGFRLEGGVAIASTWLLGQDTFLKLSGLGQGFWTQGRLQLRADARYDQGIPLDGSVLLPEVERFFAGGDDTVRGFEEDRLATELIAVPVPPLDGGCDPDDPTAGGLCQVRLLPAGGNLRALATLDAQVTLWKLAGIPVASAVFVDAGLVTNTWAAVRARSIRPSAGMALRWLLPIGALSIEYALPLAPRLGDNPRGRFHLAVALRY